MRSLLKSGGDEDWVRERTCRAARRWLRGSRLPTASCHYEESETKVAELPHNHRACRAVAGTTSELSPHEIRNRTRSIR